MPNPRSLIWLILAVYAVLAVFYAVRTPIWQAPDEPAHFNYIQAIADGQGLPVLQQGDYDFAYLEQLKAAKFPPNLSIEKIRYEGHQAPLYYLLATPLFIASRGLPLEGQVLVLRLFSVFLGCLLILAAYAVARRVFPRGNLMALSVPAFIALLPQHIAMSASIDNDILAGLLVTVILLLLAREVFSPTLPSQEMVPTVLLGVMAGLALLTKETAYTVLILVPVGLVLGDRLRPEKKRRGVGKRLLVIGAIAFVVAGWWFVRNAFVYGPTDLLGLQRHDLVVTGQPLTTYNLATLRSFVAITFKSFWAQFGWMGVPADARTYSSLAALSGSAILAFILFVIRASRERSALTPSQRDWLKLGALELGLVVVGLIIYNLRFFQPQGRYLFSAVVPIAIFFNLGLRELISQRYAPLVFVLVYAGLTALNVVFLVRLIPLL